MMLGNPAKERLRARTRGGGLDGGEGRGQGLTWKGQDEELGWMKEMKVEA